MQATELKLTAQQRREQPKQVDTTDLFISITQEHKSRANGKGDLSNHQEGLGRLPSYLPSINSVLLFNTDENPYKTYASFNNLEGVGGQDRAKADNSIASAPTSLIEGVERLASFKSLPIF